MWRCKRCETDNADTDTQCNGCDWHCPNLSNLKIGLLKEIETPTYSIKWRLTNTTKASIDNGIGDITIEGETILSIKEKTQLNISAINEHAERTFTKTLNLPMPRIDSFAASETIISLGTPVSLQWKVKYADKITLSEFGDVTSLNKIDVSLNKASSIVLTAENPSGEDRKSITFELPQPEIKDFISDRIKTMEGEEIILSWTTVNAEKLFLSYVGEIEPMITTKKIVLDKTSILVLKATNNSGSVTKDLLIEILPKPEIKSLKLNKPIALLNDEVEIVWEASNFSKLFLLMDEDVIDVTAQTSYSFIADKSKEVSFVCESIENLKRISQLISLKVIEKVSVNYLVANRLFTIQSKPIMLSWSVSNANQVVLLPSKKLLETEGTIEMCPSVKTLYIIEAKNELTTDRKEIEIDVLPLPSISNIRLVSPPVIKLPSFIEGNIKLPHSQVKKNKFHSIIKNYLSKKFIIKEPASIKTASISFTQHVKHIGIDKENSLMGLVAILKSMNKPDIKLFKSKTEKIK